ncbi:MAG: hypothetical protein KAG97_11120, partial [Victivallales bacterium]|nr:hypothetical protein [Victivallales bacterium]
MIISNERGSKKIATIIATSMVAIFIAIFAYAIFVPSNSPIMLIFNKNRYKTEEKRKDAVIYFESEQWEQARDALVASIEL